ncbi:hypothetical protein HDU91_004837 [Kappamyces sp. JEL0680]|nr:hypothetical protein HDU91_004837 [Kappamyces sp. JEL0680]
MNGSLDKSTLAGCSAIDISSTDTLPPLGSESLHQTSSPQSNPLEINKSVPKEGKSVKKMGSKKIQFRYKDPVMESGTPRPVLSYNELIIEAINSTECGMMSLQEIYDYIQDAYEYFKSTTVAWQNSIRHNLSVQKIFERVPRPANMPGKGGLWRLTPHFEIETRSPEAIQAEIDSRSEKRAKSKKRRSTKQESDDEDEYRSVASTPRKRQQINHPISHKTVETTAGTLVNSPFTSTTPKHLNPEEYQGTHLMDTLANIALSAEAHNFEWLQQSASWTTDDTIPATELGDDDRLKSFLPQNFTYRPDLQIKQPDTTPTLVLLNNLGDKTLFQATSSVADFL